MKIIRYGITDGENWCILNKYKGCKYYPIDELKTLHNYNTALLCHKQLEKITGKKLKLVKVNIDVKIEEI